MTDKGHVCYAAGYGDRVDDFRIGFNGSIRNQQLRAAGDVILPLRFEEMQSSFLFAAGYHLHDALFVTPQPNIAGEYLSELFQDKTIQMKVNFKQCSI